MDICLCTFTGQAMGGDAWQSLSADVAEGRSGVRAGVPVVHPREMFHVELAGLQKEKICKKKTTTPLSMLNWLGFRGWNAEGQTKLISALHHNNYLGEGEILQHKPLTFFILWWTKEPEEAG